MKLCRLRQGDKTLPAVALGDTFYDVSGAVTDFNADFFADGGVSKLASLDMKSMPEVTSHDGFAPCVARPSKVLCIGLNYHDHAKEAGMAVPTEPVVFFKAPSSLSGAGDDIPYPVGATMLDWEVELAFVVGKRTKGATKETAMESIAGFMILNDVSERNWQMNRGGQWAKGKSHDGFAPIGPYLVTADEVADPHSLAMTLKLNGETMQSGNTKDFIFDLATVVTHLSEFMTLEPGDVVTTGTPAGVGFGMEPKKFLKPGDALELEIDGLGKQTAKVVQA